MTQPKLRVTEGWEKTYYEIWADILNKGGNHIYFYQLKDIIKDIEILIRYLLSRREKEMIETLDKGKNHDYEAIGMGSLDYHEKCAIDGYIEWLKAILKEEKGDKL